MIDLHWQTARNILLVRLDNLGDVLLTTPAFHAVKTSLPSARLTLLASPMVAQVGLLDPDIDDIGFVLLQGGPLFVKNLGENAPQARVLVLRSQ